MRAYIGSTPLDLPPDFKFPIERYSPSYDDSLRIGDLSMGIDFPATPNNRIAFGFADELHQASKVITYPDFRIEAGSATITGLLQLKNATQALAGGSFSTNFVTNVIPKINEPIHRVLTKTSDLGSATAAVIAAAAAQNAAAMSLDGVSGAVMKFVPHYSPNLYSEEANPDWNPDARAYDGTSEYSVGEKVYFQISRAYDVPSKYICVIAADVGETPATHPAKWQLYTPPVANDWDAANGQFYTNETVKIAGRFFKNRHALVPWLQLMDVVREVCKGIGYTLEGDYPKDPWEARALIESNFAQAKPDSFFLNLQLNDAYDNNAVALPPGVLTDLDSIVVDPDAENDAQSMYNAGLIEFSRKGTYVLKWSGFVWIDEGAIPTKLRLHILLADDTPVQSALIEFPVGTFPSGTDQAYFEFRMEYDYDYVGADDTVLQQLKVKSDVQGDDGLGGVVINGYMNWSNVVYEGLDTYSGQVRYADHVPAMSVADFFIALEQWKGLHITFNPINKTVRMDYLDQLLRQQARGSDLLEHAEQVSKPEYYAKRRYEMKYGVEPGETDTTFAGYTKLDPIDTLGDINGFILGNSIAPNERKAVLVRSLNRWLLTAPSAYFDQMTWKAAAHDYPTLRIESEGDLVEIAPALGPVPMGYFRNTADQIVTCPSVETEGRASAFGQTADRAPFRIAYWIGMDTSVIEDGYPLASTTRYNAGGIEVLARDMSLVTIYTLHWKRILQLMVLEERVTAYFHFPPEVEQLISFARVMLLGQVPIIPIRTAKELSAQSISGGQMEIEARKVKMVEIEVVSAITQIDEETPWTPINTDTYLWYDNSDESSLTLLGSKIETVKNKSENDRHLVTVSGSGNPDYEPSSINNLASWKGSGVSQVKRAYNCEINEASFYYVLQFSTDGYIQDGGPTARLGIRRQYGNLVLVDDSSATRVAGPISAGEPHIIRIHFVNNGSMVYLNGTQLGSLITPFARTNLITELTIGAWRGGTVNFNGLFGEMICIQNVPFENISQRVEGYLAHKWGLAGKLPANHPYKSSPPTI